MFGLRIGAMGRVGSGLTLNQAAANVRAAYSTSPQVWYDPSDLVWNWRRNLLTYSEQFDNAAWVNDVGGAGSAPVRVANDALAPDGTLTADKLTFAAPVSGDQSLLGQTVSGLTVGASYTVTFYVKAAAAPDIGKTLVYRSVAAASYSFVTLTAEYQRVSLTAAAAASSLEALSIGLRPNQGGSTGTVAAHIWGAQLEVGTTATPYQRITDGVQDYYVYGSALPTLYQDSAGTTPVTAVGQPVGLMLDKSRGLVLGANVIADPSFDSPAYWSVTNAGWAVGSGVATATALPDGQSLFRPGAVVPGTTYLVSFEIKAITSGAIYASIGGTTSTAAFTTVGVKTCIVRAGAGTNANIISAGVTNCVVDNISVRELPGLHASQPTALSRPVLQQENGLLFLLCDGTDDGMVTPSWDLTSTDKVTVVAGVRKLSDAASGVVAELSASIGSNTGAFVAYAPLTAAANFAFSTRGTSAGTANAISGSTFASPVSAVCTGLGNISGDSVTLRSNGVQAAASAADQGTGTYGNYPLYLFRRGGSSLPFNGRFYGLSIIGASLSANDITVLEKFTAAKTGVTVA